MTSFICVLLSAVVFKSMRATPRFIITLTSALLRVTTPLSNSTTAAMKSGAELSCNPSPIIVLRNSSSLLAFSPAGISSPVRK